MHVVGEILTENLSALSEAARNVLPSTDVEHLYACEHQNTIRIIQAKGSALEIPIFYVDCK